MSKKKWVAIILVGIVLLGGVVVWNWGGGNTINKNRPIPANIPQDIKDEINRLYDSDVDTRVYAIDNLARMGKRAEGAIPWLIDLLGDRSRPSLKSNPVADIAACALRVIDGDVAFQAVVQATSSDDKTVRLFSIWSFPNENKCETGHMELKAVPYVLKLIRDHNYDVREAAASRLWGLAGKNYGDNPDAWEKWWAEYQKQHP